MQLEKKLTMFDRRRPIRILLIQLCLSLLLHSSPSFAYSLGETTGIDEALSQLNATESAISNLSEPKKDCLETVAPDDPCKVVYDLSAAMNKHVRDIPFETLVSLLALGAGRSGDFVKYLSEKRDSTLSLQQNEEKALKKEIDANHEAFKKNKKALKKLRELAQANEADPTTQQLLREAEAEYRLLSDKKFSLFEALETAEQETEKTRLLKAKIAMPYWHLKLIQIGLAGLILGHEVFLCQQKSASCIFGQLADVIWNPNPPQDPEEANRAARYESIPALLILDVERQKITRDDACFFIQHDKKLLADFALVKTLMTEMRNPN